MILNLQQLFNRVVEQVPVEYEIPLAELDEIRGYRFHSAVQVKGEFENRAGIVTFRYTTTFALELMCDRCLKSFVRDFRYDFTHTVVQALHSENDDYIVAAKEQVNVNEIAVTDLLLQLPTKILCREDCKGLCPTCGCDRNESECDCQNE